MQIRQNPAQVVSVGSPRIVGATCMLWCLIVVGHGLVAADNTAGNSTADKQTFDTVVKPFLEQHCISCHGEKKNKGDVRLHQMDYDLASARDLDKWQSCA